MTRDGGTLAIMQSVLGLGSRLGLDVVAEGVETDEQLVLLRQLGCRLVQGHLIARPLDRDGAATLLSRKKVMA